MGVGDATQDGKLIDAAVEDLRIITGQQPKINRARKSIANFKLREGQADRCPRHVARRADVGVLRPAGGTCHPPDP